MTKSNQGLAFLVLAMAVSPPATAASIEDLFEQPTYKQIRISPTGDYFAIRIFQDGAHSLAFTKRESPDVVGGLKFSGTDEVGDFYWANNERVVAQVFDVGGTQESPVNYGELYAVNYDGKRAQSIFGYRSGESQVGSIIRRRTADLAWGELIDTVADNDREVLISSKSMSESFDRRPVAIMLDIYTGLESGRIHASKFPDATFFTDGHGEIRLVVGVGEDNRVRVEGLPLEAREWIEFSELNHGSHFTPVAIADNRKSAYVLDNIQSDKIGLFELSLDGTQYKRVYANEEVDITGVNISSDGKSVYAVRLDRSYPSYVMVSSDHEEAQIFKNMLQTFPGQTVDITSHSDDGRFWVVKTSSDVDPGTFYLFDREANALRPISRSLPNIRRDELSRVSAIEFESFDGGKISGYFTPALIEGNGVAPMVVLVHGGPRARDYWRFDPEVQALATSGFSVLQVNYRGSSGFGNAFLRAGNQHWGDQVQQDILAGVRWAIASGKARDGKVCIMGASFGAYSAVQSAILDPDLFACVVANAGIYDLEMLYEQGQVQQRFWGDAYLEEVIGRDEEQLKQFSPVSNVAALKAPIFVAHGKRDDTAPYEHAKRLREELDEHGKEYEWFVRAREAHGFYDTRNQVEYFEEVVRFLDKHLK